MSIGRHIGLRCIEDISLASDRYRKSVIDEVEMWLLCLPPVTRDDVREEFSRIVTALGELERRMQEVDKHTVADPLPQLAEIDSPS